MKWLKRNNEKLLLAFAMLIVLSVFSTIIYAADTKLSDMTKLAQGNDDLLLYVVTDPNVTPLDRKIPWEELILPWDGSANITTVGTIGTGTWQGTVIDHERGGIETDISGIADGGILVGTGAGTMGIRASALTAGAAGFFKHELGGLEADVSAYESILAISGGATLDLDTSAEMATAIDDETGTGVMVFGTSPTFTTSIILTGANAAPSATGHIVYDNVTTGVENGMLSWHDSNEPRFIVDLFTLPVDDGDVVTYDAAADKFVMAAPSASAGSSFYDRADTTTYDWYENGSKAVFNTDNTWRDLDCSGIVPAGTEAILFNIYIEDNATNSSFLLRCNGDTGVFHSGGCRTQSATVGNDANLWISCDANRVVEYKGGNVAFTAIYLTIIGYAK